MSTSNLRKNRVVFLTFILGAKVVCLLDIPCPIQLALIIASTHVTAYAIKLGLSAVFICDKLSWSQKKMFVFPWANLENEVNCPRPRFVAYCLTNSIYISLINHVSAS